MLKNSTPLRTRVPTHSLEKFVRKKGASLFCSHKRGGWGEEMKAVKNKQLPVTEGTPMAALYIGWAFGSLWRTAAMQAID